jgi:hypothetical protein
MKKFFYDKGKPLETMGRKATGPNSQGYGSRATERRVLLLRKRPLLLYLIVHKAAIDPQNKMDSIVIIYTIK